MAGDGRPPAAILDVDGTLVDSNYQRAMAWFRAFREHGLAPAIWRIHRHIGMGGDQLVAAVAGDAAEESYGDSLRDAERPTVSSSRKCAPSTVRAI